eukprot:g2084.t1
MLQRCPFNRAISNSICYAVTKSTFSGIPRRRIFQTYHGHRRLITMASSETVAAAYANALASLAESSEKLSVIHSDISRLSKILRDTEGLADFLGNPVTDEEKRHTVLSTICKEGGFDQDTENFLKLVMDKGRAGFLPEMCEVFEEEYCKKTETLVATVTSAVQLEEDETFEIAKKLRELSGAKNVKLKPVIDPSLIAGFTVEFGSSQIDLSVKGQLSKLSQEMLDGET